MSDNGQLFSKKKKSLNNSIINTDSYQNSYIDQHKIPKENLDGDEDNKKVYENQKSSLKTDVLNEKRKKVSDVIDVSLNKRDSIIGEKLILENPREKIANRRINNATINSMRHRIGITDEPFFMYFRRNACSNKKELALREIYDMISDNTTLVSSILSKDEPAEAEKPEENFPAVQYALAKAVDKYIGTKEEAISSSKTFDICSLSIVLYKKAPLRPLFEYARISPSYVLGGDQKEGLWYTDFTDGTAHRFCPLQANTRGSIIRRTYMRLFCIFGRLIPARPG